MGRPSFRVDALRDGAWWILTSPDAPGAVSQVRRLSQADEHAREAIAFVMDIDEESFDIDVVPQLPRLIAEEVRIAREAVDRAAAAAREAAERQRKIVQDLAITEGLSGREIALVLGVSPQRVSQLSADATVAAVRSAAQPPATARRKVAPAKVSRATGKRVSTTGGAKRAAVAKTARRGVAARKQPR